MDPAPAIGNAMTLLRGLLCALVFLPLPVDAHAGDRYAVVVSGASGGPDFAAKHDRWRSELVATIRTKLRFPDANVLVFGETPSPGIEKATREAVRAAFQRLGPKLTRDDLLLVVLIGHGTSDGTNAKFNLVGPDLDAAEWTELLAGVPAQIALVNTTGGSFPFLQRLSAPHRVVITATDSAAQQYETVFAEFFGKSFLEPSADLDKNGRISLLESFNWTSAQVKEWYEQRGQLSTERPVLDDNADGTGKEAGAPGPDGSLAARVYLDEDADSGQSSDPAVAALRQKRAELEMKIDELKKQKGAMTQEEYERTLEPMLIELAELSKQIRSKSN
jgi:hypothetical protein